MKELSQKLERLIETAVEKEEIAGANIVVIRDGQEMAFAADGYADIEAGKKYERGWGPLVTTGCRTAPRWKRCSSFGPPSDAGSRRGCHKCLLHGDGKAL